MLPPNSEPKRSTTPQPAAQPAAQPAKRAGDRTASESSDDEAPLLLTPETNRSPHGLTRCSLLLKYGVSHHLIGFMTLASSNGVLPIIGRSPDQALNLQARQKKEITHKKPSQHT